MLQGFLTSEPGMMLQLSTAVAYGNAVSVAPHILKQSLSQALMNHDEFA